MICNFGLFGSLERARWLLRRFHRMTSGRGRIIAETAAPFGTYVAGDPLDLAYEERNKALGRMRGQIRQRIRYRDLKGPWSDYLYVSRDEMREIVDGIGWVEREPVDSDGDPFYGIIEKTSAEARAKLCSLLLFALCSALLLAAFRRSDLAAPVGAGRGSSTDLALQPGGIARRASTRWGMLVGPAGSSHTYLVRPE